MMIKLLRIITIIFLSLLIVGALYGGGSFIYDPTGESIQIPIELLEGTLFSNYLIPGIILLCSIGFLSILVIILTIRKTVYYPSFMILQGYFLVGWLTIEIIINQLFFTPMLHYPLYTIGILLILFGIIINEKLDDIQR